MSDIEALDTFSWEPTSEPCADSGLTGTGDPPLLCEEQNHGACRDSTQDASRSPSCLTRGSQHCCSGSAEPSRVPGLPTIIPEPQEPTVGNQPQGRRGLCAGLPTHLGRRGPGSPHRAAGTVRSAQWGTVAPGSGDPVQAPWL